MFAAVTNPQYLAPPLFRRQRRPVLLPSFAPDAPSLRWFMLSGRTKALSAVSLDQCLPAKAVSAVMLGQRSAYQQRPIPEIGYYIFFIGTIF